MNSNEKYENISMIINESLEHLSCVFTGKMDIGSKIYFLKLGGLIMGLEEEVRILKNSDLI